MNVIGSVTWRVKSPVEAIGKLEFCEDVRPLKPDQVCDIIAGDIRKILKQFERHHPFEIHAVIDGVEASLKSNE
jgi:hypothetical protein